MGEAISYFSSTFPLGGFIIIITEHILWHSFICRTNCQTFSTGVTLSLSRRSQVGGVWWFVFVGQDHEYLCRAFFCTVTVLFIVAWLVV